jgi:predicted polyphosphate/ATP-dependent NAD kinase
MGGPLGFKGTDGNAYNKAVELGATKTAHLMAKRALANMRDDIMFVSVANMGSEVLEELGISHKDIASASDVTTAEDTKNAAKLMAKDCNLILFCGGDGTAKDIYDAVGESIPVLGIPAGVKMYSSVFAATPESVHDIVNGFIDGTAKLTLRDVMDMNEESYWGGSLSARFYGHLNVPYVPKLVQNSKGVYNETNEAEEADEVAEYVLSTMTNDVIYIIGPGSTTGLILKKMGIEPTILGFDAVLCGELISKDTNEREIMALTEIHDKITLILGIVGKQGFFLGRGNKELTPTVLRKIGLDNIVLISGATKLNALDELRVDTGDPELDKALRGFRKVVFKHGRERMMKVS